ncbi:MAG: glycosyltransferase family 4 protein [Candidatus Omnitrophica bacterium]|nr:glycosyltransferase family 4 protein [Candidatus Omnitrophota bacterium]
MNILEELKKNDKMELINEVIVRQNLLRHFFTSKYHRLRVILFYIKRFIYLTLLKDFKNKFRDTFRVKKVLKTGNKNKNSIKVLYDFQTFTAQKVGGISRLFFEIIKDLSKDKEVKPELALRYSDNIYLKNASFFADKKTKKIITENPPPLRHFEEIIPPSPFLEDSLLINFFRKFFLKILSLKYITPGTSFSSLKGPWYYTYYEANLKTAINFLKKGDFDVFHPTYYDTYFLKYLRGKPFVLTIHDMIHEKYSYYHHPNDVISNQKKILAQKAKKIIAVSSQTKKDIIEILKISAEKIVVIPHASKFNNKKLKNIKIKGLPKKYFLFVGQRVTYKNFNFFIKAIAPILRKEKDLYMVCVGDFPSSGPFTDDELNLFKRLKISKKMIYYRADDDILAYLYSKAYAFVFPTLAEGFGIPVLEAFSLGCPVLCSDIPVLREVAEDGALYFNPKSQKSIQKAVGKILKDKRLRYNLINKGKKINKKYSWKKTAESYKKVYLEIFNG